MNMLALASRSACRGWFVVLSCLFVVGGAVSDDSKTLRTNTPDEKGKSDDKKPPSDAKVRLLGAIIPAGDETHHFVKFLGPIEKIEANEKDFDVFLNSIRVPGEGGKPISWTVPAGWKEGPARQFRVVTLQKEGVPDMYVSEPFGGSTLNNANRWRSELGLKEATEDELPGLLKEVNLGKTKASRVDFRGPGRPSK